MSTTTDPSGAPAKSTYMPGTVAGLALRLADAENALRALTSGQVDAVIDPNGQAYLLRPAQEHLRRHEQLLQAVIDSSADVLTVVDRGGSIVLQSRASKRVLGYEPDELTGRMIFELVHEEDLALLYIAYFNVIEGFKEQATVRFRHRDRHGSDRLVEAAISQLRGFSPPSVIMSVRPVTSPLLLPANPARTSAIDQSV
jgi:PAS domain S-box-containing protein